MEDRKFAVLFAATILAARKLSELEAQGITRPCPAREIIITDAISKAEEIMRKVEKNYRPSDCNIRAMRRLTKVPAASGSLENEI
jgi:hypothetical protein